MTQQKPPAAINAVEPHDPYKMRTLEQIIMLFDGGGFMAEIMEGHKKLMQDMLEHHAEHGSKGCKGTMTLQVDYGVGKTQDVGMGATVTFKAPKKPASGGHAYINDNGELTVFSPMMRQMQRPVRDATDYDPETGEVRDTE
jgi:hypothetical protein